MNKRNYNVFFNLHTVSGIIISFVLYIIFFAGAFALFKDEITIWEEGEPISHIQRKDIDFDNILDKLDKKHELVGRDINFNFDSTEDNLRVFMGASKDSLASEKGKIAAYFITQIRTVETQTYSESYSIGEFLYRLHFLAQFPTIGIYLAGFVAFIFLFAIVTGVIVHWKKIIPNFYAFNPKLILKRVWTDAHTALGIIGLPFQFVFAITGTYFCLSLLVLAPANILYENDQDKLMEDLRPSRKNYEWSGQSQAEKLSFNSFAQAATEYWPNFHIQSGEVKNFGGADMNYVFIGEVDSDEQFLGKGRIVYNAYSGEIIEEKSPFEVSYIEGVQDVISTLHYGDFGNYPVKIIYFVLALITCFVIITGVLIWIESRNRKNMTISQRVYTGKVGHFYMAICLSMLPVTALSFLFVKFSNGSFADKQGAIYSFYFIAWVIAILVFRLKKDNYLTNKYSLLLGSVFGIMVPISNGFVSGNWMWESYLTNQTEMLFVDALWTTIAVLSFIIFCKIKPKVKEQSTFIKDPIDYKKAKKLRAEKRKEDDTIFNKKEITMRTKIIILWIFLAIGWLVHHIYGLFNIYYNETLVMDGATGDVPFVHHLYRILFEGCCLLFGLLTIEMSRMWFRWTSFIWAIISGGYNLFHFLEAIIHEGSNFSELFMLLLVLIGNGFLILNLHKWKKVLAD